jgi:DNA-binding transcriptional ArsR family regulator
VSEPLAAAQPDEPVKPVKPAETVKPVTPVTPVTPVDSRLTAVSDRHIRMALDPWPTATALTLEALGERRGSPASWCRAVRASLDPDDVALLGPVTANGGVTYIPDCLLPRSPTFSPTFDDYLERVATTPPDVVAADLIADGLLDSPWAPMIRHPRRWLAAYAGAMRRAWVAVRPLWDRAAPLLDSEVERVGVALVRGSFDVLVDGLHPRGCVRDGRWYLGRPEKAVAIAPGMVIAPMVAGPRWAFAGVRGGVVSELSYPLPGARRLVNPDIRAVHGDALTALVGAPRAEILRRLDRAVTAGSLAESMVLVPSAISHHLHNLERAGLVRRTRHGRHVLVQRTTRGTALVNVYDG